MNRTLIDDIYAAQRDAGEAVVVQYLERKGLMKLDPVGPYILLTRNPTNGWIVVISDEDKVTQFETKAKAIECADNQPLCKAWGYQIVEVEL